MSTIAMTAEQKAKQKEIDKQFDKDLDDTINTIFMVMIIAIVLQQFITNAINSSALALQVTQIQDDLHRQQYLGATDPREYDTLPAALGGQQIVLDLMNTAPFRPWSFMRINNDGPDDVYIGINSPTEWVRAVPHITTDVDRTNADNRIERIYIPPAGVAHVLLTGEY